MPVAGIAGTDLIESRGFARVADPYTGQEFTAVPAIRPDWAVIHAHEADEEGNARIDGSVYEDPLIARAARKVLVTCERLVSREVLAREPERVTIPGVLVTAVVEAPRGAYPTSCGHDYGYDREFVTGYLEAAATGDEGCLRFIRERVLGSVPAGDGGRPDGGDRAAAGKGGVIGG